MVDPPVDVGPGVERGEARRYLEVLRRNATLIGAIVGTVTLGVLLISLLLPSRYEATARLVLQDDSSPLTSPDAATTERRLATAETFVQSPAVLRRASAKLGNVSASDLDDQIDSSVDPKANIIEVKATTGSPHKAAAEANAVSRVFLNQRASAERSQIATTLADVQEAMARISKLKATPGAIDPAEADAQLAALRTRANDLAAREPTVGQDLRLVQPATPPSGAASPKPLLNALIAFFVSLVVAVLVALGRDQLVPRASDPREISRVLGVPLLSAIPVVRRRLVGSVGMQVAAEREAFESLRNAVETAVADDADRIILVSSAAPGEGKTTVVERLGRSLAGAGRDTLLLSADMRRADLHRRFGMPAAPGLADILGAATRGRRQVAKTALTRAIRMVEPRFHGGRGRGRLALLPSGTPSKDVAQMLVADVVDSLFERVRQLDYDYVLVDAPGLLGTADAQVLAQAADRLLLVSNLEVVTIDQLVEEREVLDRLEADPLGVVVIGGRPQVSPYEPSLAAGEEAEDEARSAGLLSLPARGRAPKRRREEEPEGDDLSPVAPTNGEPEDHAELEERRPSI